MRVGALATLILFFLSSFALAETIEGKVTVKSSMRKAVKGNQSKALRKGNQQRRYARKAKVRGKKRDEARSVVISVLNPPDSGSKRGGKMQQKDQTFIPYVLPIVAGSQVDFPNDDKIYHGVYSESSCKTFELPQYANGESRSVTFPKEGVVELFCHIHAHMNAYILILGSSYFDQPDENHAYKIGSLKPGKYRVKAWHPRLGSKIQSVEVKAGQKAKLDFTL